MSWIVSQTMSETTMLAVWGLALLVVGRQVRPRAVERTALRVASTPRLASTAAKLEASIGLVPAVPAD